MMNGWVRGRVGDGVEKGVRGDMKVDDQDANRRLGGTSGGLYLYTQTASTHLYMEIQYVCTTHSPGPLPPNTYSPPTMTYPETN